MYRPLRRVAIVLLCLTLPELAAAQQPGVGSAERMAEFQARAAENRNAGARQMAEQRRGGERAEIHAADHRRNLSEAVRRVQRRTGGQILGAEVVPFEGRNISRIKYMDDRGRVRYMDDPGPGERLRQSPPRRDNNGQP
jgi:hypothetical protein